MTTGAKSVSSRKLTFARSAGAAGEVSFIQNNVDDEEAVRRMIESIICQHGRLDFAVNNAGVSTENKVLSESDTQAFKAMIDEELKR